MRESDLPPSGIDMPAFERLMLRDLRAHTAATYRSGVVTGALLVALVAALAIFALAASGACEVHLW